MDRRNDEMMDLQPHPAADIFPEMTAVEFEALKQDIREQGLREPIVCHEGCILDGRHRYRACVELGIKPTTKIWDGKGSLFDFVISLNLKRRHLDVSQRTMIAARVADLGQGARTDLQQICGMSQAEAAAKLGVSVRGVQTAKYVLDLGTPELIKAADSGRIAVDLASAIAEQEPELQDRIAKAALESDDPKQARAMARRVFRQARHESIIRETTCPSDWQLPDFAVVYADPPWLYNDTRDGMGGADDEYPTLPEDKICSFLQDRMVPINKDAVLFLWVTIPQLPSGLRVMEAWGFEYRTAIVWDKQLAALGNYLRIRTELLLIGVRGSMPPPIDASNENLLSVKRGRHSAKPDEARALIEAMYGEHNKIEIFARKETPGWVAMINGKIKLNHRGDTRDGCPACDGLDEALARIYHSRLCLSGKGHFTAADLLRDIDALQGACGAARRVAIMQLTATAAAIAAASLTDDAQATAPAEGDRLLDVTEAATKTGMSRDQLYRRKDLPFRVKTGPGQVRFSEAGIEKWIRAKTVRPAA